MSDNVQILLAFCFLVVVFILTRAGIIWKMKKTVGEIIRDLESKGAVDPITAVELPYAKANPIRIGMRDYYSKSVEYLVSEGIVGKTSQGKYYMAAKLPGRG